jgi:hypothetical protein
MNRSHLSLSLYALLIFAGGASVGALGHRLYAASSVKATSGPGKPDEWRRRFMAEMRERVKVNGSQEEWLSQILDESKVLYDQVRQKYQPEMRAIHDSQVTKIKEILSAEQAAEYLKIVDEQRKAREGRR